MALQQTPIHQSLIRPTLLGGAERELAMINGSISAALVMGVGSWQSVITGIIFGICVHLVLVRLAKIDPMFFEVFKRHLTYQDYYPAHSELGAPTGKIKRLNLDRN